MSILMVRKMIDALKERFHVARFKRHIRVWSNRALPVVIGKHGPATRCHLEVGVVGQGIAQQHRHYARELDELDWDTRRGILEIVSLRSSRFPLALGGRGDEGEKKKKLFSDFTPRDFGYFRDCTRHRTRYEWRAVRLLRSSRSRVWYAEIYWLPRQLRVSRRPGK